MASGYRYGAMGRWIAILVLGAPIALASDGPSLSTPPPAASPLGSVSPVSSVSVERLVRDDLEQFLRERAADAEVEIEMPRLSAFGVDPSRYDAGFRTELTTRSREPFSGRVPVTISLFSGERLVKRGIVSPYLKVSVDVVVARRDLKRGEILDREDLEIVSMDQAKLPRDVLTEPDTAIGRRTRRPIRKGYSFRTSQIESVPLVERGDRVTVVLEAGALRLQSTGRAQQAGALGEVIRVLNLDSKREILGRVDAQGRVRVAN